jgi:predicted outer membrane repeat protein
MLLPSLVVIRGVTFATTITVNSLADPGRTGICALRDAITAANTKKATHGCAAGTGSDQIMFSVKGTINLANALPNVTDKLLTDTGPITISGQNKTKIVSVASYATLHLTNLTMTEGIGAYDPATGNYEGGAIWNGGTVTLYNTSFTDNYAANLGGAIYNVGTLTVTNSVFTGNGSDYGGTISNAGKLTVTNSGFYNNGANSGGGLLNNGPGFYGGTGTGTATITKSIFSGNSGHCGDGCGSGGGIENGGTLTVTNSIFSGNTTNGSGGGIDSGGPLTIINSTFSYNSALANASGGSGGGISSGGTLTVTNSTFLGNSAGGQTSCGGFGGGIDGGRGTITNSTFTDNWTDSAGGGINGGTLTVTNSTFVNNSANCDDSGYGNGGGINGGPLTITNSTFADNSAVDGGGIYGVASVKSTILAAAGNSSGNCAGTITDAGNNISDDSTCNFSATGSQNNTNPGLSTAGLANNGGPTQTIALVPGSPAIDAIPLAACTDQTGKRITTDQRGFPRPDAGEAVCDTGAYESSF